MAFGHPLCRCQTWLGHVLDKQLAGMLVRCFIEAIRIHRSALRLQPPLVHSNETSIPRRTDNPSPESAHCSAISLGLPRAHHSDRFQNQQDQQKIHQLRCSTSNRIAKPLCLRAKRITYRCSGPAASVFSAIADSGQLHSGGARRLSLRAPGQVLGCGRGLDSSFSC